MNARALTISLGIILVIFVSCTSYADTREILVFRDVDIPWALTHGDVVIEKGKYDVFLIQHGIERFCLKIRQSGKVICLIKNPTKIKYTNNGTLYEMLRDPDVSKDAKLCIKRNPTINTAYFVIETGHCKQCQFQRLRFQVKSMET